MTPAQRHRLGAWGAISQAELAAQLRLNHVGEKSSNAMQRQTPPRPQVQPDQAVGSQQQPAMTIDLVIPTLWRSPSLLTSLQHYEACPQIARIILIDNEPSSRPAQLALTTGKLQVLNQKRNIFVNPAWNLGVKASTAPIVCLLNDDIEVQPEVFSFVTEIDWITRQIDIIGILLGECYVETILQRIKPNKQSPLGSQVFSFGACMFLQRRSYTPIPEDLQVWFGDDYLTHHNDGVFLLSTPHISGSMSKTIKSFPPNSPLHDAIAKDIEYAQGKLGIVNF